MMFIRRYFKVIFAIVVGLLLQSCAHTQVLSRNELKEAAVKSLPTSLEEYRDFLSIPNIGSIERHRDDNVQWCVNTFDELGFETQIIRSHEIPHVYAEKIIDPTYKSVLFYLQIDGQPVDSSEWDQTDPFTPVVKQMIDGAWVQVPWKAMSPDYNRDLRFFARSASDSKGPAMAFITALKILNGRGITPAYNLKVIMDFQEELGSPTLPDLVRNDPALLSAEIMLIMDGTRHLSNLPTLTFGARGITTVKLKVFGANKNLHSGQYGNFAPNPVFKLAKLLSGIKDDAGRVLLPGFYDGVNLSEEDKRIMNSLPEDMAEIKKTLGIAEIDSVGNTYQEALQYPSFNVRGLQAAWVDSEVRTLIPEEAIAEIDMRLVPETPAERQLDILRKYILNQGYHIIEGNPTDGERAQYPKLISMTYKIGSKPFRTDIDSDIGRWLSKTMSYLYGDQFVKMRTTGGSQPIAPFITTLNIPAVSIRIPNPDNSIHAPNENLRLGNYVEGIEMCLSILTHRLDD